MRVPVPPHPHRHPAAGDHAGKDLVLVSPKGQLLWRRNLVPTSGLTGYGSAGYARDGRTIYVWGNHRDGRVGVWAIPAAGGPPRRVIRWDDPNLTVPGLTNPLRPDVGPDRIYLTVSQYDSDIWVANLRWQGDWRTGSEVVSWYHDTCP